MSNYRRGAAFELRVAKALEEDGYFVVRSAGSHGAADLVALKLGEVLLVQCKRSGAISREDWNDLVRLRQRLDPRGETVHALLALMPGVRGIEYRRLLYQLAHNERRDLAYLRWVPDKVRDDRGTEEARVGRP